MKRKELEKLCKDNNIKTRPKQLDVIDGKDFINITVSEWREIFKKRGNLQRVSLEADMKVYSDLYEACKKQGYTGVNPFKDSIELSSENLLYYINKGIYVSSHDLNKAISSLNNKEYWECFVRLQYEGAMDNEKIYSLKKDDVDLENRKIYLQNTVINMSQKLYDSIITYYEIKTYGRFFLGGKGQMDITVEYPLIEAYPGSFVRLSDDAKAQGGSTQFKNMATKVLKDIDIKQARLYFSGLVNFLYRKCDYSEELLEYLFFEDNRYTKTIKNKDNDIKSWIKEYGLSLSLSATRYRYGFYVRDFINRL